MHERESQREREIPSVTVSLTDKETSRPWPPRAAPWLANHRGLRRLEIGAHETTRERRPRDCLCLGSLLLIARELRVHRVQVSLCLFLEGFTHAESMTVTASRCCPTRRRRDIALSGCHAPTHELDVQLPHGCSGPRDTVNAICRGGLQRSYLPVYHPDANLRGSARDFTRAAHRGHTQKYSQSHAHMPMGAKFKAHQDYQIQKSGGGGRRAPRTVPSPAPSAHARASAPPCATAGTAPGGTPSHPRAGA